MPKFIDITGNRFGRLVAVSLYQPGSRKNKPLWLFKCDCGNNFICTANRVKTGNTKSCGCLSFEMKSARSRDALKIAHKACVTHGATGTRLYRIYKNMKNRCNNHNTPCYRFYGGKGIRVCDEWLNDPKAFIDWALSRGYADNLTIERIDSSKNYCPENCEWITQSEQAKRAAIVRENNRKAVSQLAKTS